MFLMKTRLRRVQGSVRNNLRYLQTRLSIDMKNQTSAKKLFVQIPCFNEEHTLPQTIADIPRNIEGISEVEILIIDDGSSDRTVEIAKSLNVNHIVQHTKNQGLARAFCTGLDACLKLGADIIVNTDGDNQYAGADIPKLLQPILQGTADIVVGDRQTENVKHFPMHKKALQKFGSFVVRQLSGTELPDAVSGFRAISREAALRLNIVSSFSYTVEMIIQAGKKNMAVTHVPVAVNPKTRESHLFKSIPNFIWQQLSTMIRMYSMYSPIKVFFSIGLMLCFIGVLPIIRFLFYYLAGDGAGHIQSLILGGVFLIIGFITFTFGLLADLISFNRNLTEVALEKIRRLELNDPGNSD